MKRFTFYGFVFATLAVAAFIYSCSSSKVGQGQGAEVTVIEKRFSDEGASMEISFTAGKAHNYPTFAVWLESVEGQMLQTVFVTKSIATGYYKFGDAGDGHWLKVPGKSIRPAALPIWLHKRQQLEGVALMPTPEAPVADAYTGATPAGNLKINATSKASLPQRFRVVAEVNQPWDWNNAWNNDKYPGNSDYKTSAQPSLLYMVEIDLNNLMPEYHLNVIGHGHYAGADGKLYTDISGITSAKEIFSQIKLTIKK
jgi:hypothetical protein